MSSHHRLLRDCPVTVIPAGDAAILEAGTEVEVTQALTVPTLRVAPCVWKRT